MNKIYFGIVLLYSAINASAQNTIPETLDNIFKLKWETESGSYSSNPIVHNGLIFETFGIKYALEFETGDKLFYDDPEQQVIIKSCTKDSLVLFSSVAGQKLVNIYNGDVIFENQNSITNPWIKRPGIITEPILYTAISDTLFMAYDIHTKKEVWRKKTKSILFNQPIITENMIYITDQEFIYGINKEDGREAWKYKLGELISDPYLINDIFYAWVKEVGLIAFDINNKKILWTFIQNKYKRSFYELSIENDTIFVYSSALYALSINDGKILWKNETLKSNESYILGKSSDYLFTYKSIDDESVLVACDKKNGKIIFEGFTSIDLSKRPLSDLEYIKFRFAKESYQNTIIAVNYNKKVYCFEIIE